MSCEEASRLWMLGVGLVGWRISGGRSIGEVGWVDCDSRGVALSGSQPRHDWDIMILESFHAIFPVSALIDRWVMWMGGPPTDDAGEGGDKHERYRTPAGLPVWCKVCRHSHSPIGSDADTQFAIPFEDFASVCVLQPGECREVT